jgi:Putative auto-transporter adhesin, head GIN domain
MQRTIHSTWAFILFVFVAHLSANGQKDPFTGSDKMVTQTYNFSNFDKISIIDLDGVTEVEVGKPFSVQTEIRDKYSPILEVKELNGELTVVFKYTKDNNKYINNPAIKVKIACPTLASLSKTGNSNIRAVVPHQASFTMTNEGNGSAVLRGEVERLNLKNDGNGRIDAQHLVVKTASVQSYGNGDVIVNATERLDAFRNGNGKVVQKAEAMSKERKP